MEKGTGVKSWDVSLVEIFTISKFYEKDFEIFLNPVVHKNDIKVDMVITIRIYLY